MDEAKRRALEAEFDGKSAELSGMMEQVDEVQRAYARLALAPARTGGQGEGKRRVRGDRRDGAHARPLPAGQIRPRHRKGRGGRAASPRARQPARPRSSPSSWPSAMSATPAAAIRTSCAGRAFATEQAYRDAFPDAARAEEARGAGGALPPALRRAACPAGRDQRRAGSGSIIPKTKRLSGRFRTICQANFLRIIGFYELGGSAPTPRQGAFWSPFGNLRAQTLLVLLGLSGFWPGSPFFMTQQLMQPGGKV